MIMDTSGIRRIYALARLSRGDEALKVESVQSVPYQSVRFLNGTDGDMFTFPRLRLERPFIHGSNSLSGAPSLVCNLAMQ